MSHLQSSSVGGHGSRRRRGIRGHHSREVGSGGGDVVGLGRVCGEGGTSAFSLRRQLRGEHRAKRGALSGSEQRNVHAGFWAEREGRQQLEKADESTPPCSFVPEVHSTGLTCAARPPSGVCGASTLITPWRQLPPNALATACGIAGEGKLYSPSFRLQSEAASSSLKQLKHQKASRVVFRYSGVRGPYITSTYVDHISHICYAISWATISVPQVGLP